MDNFIRVVNTTKSNKTIYNNKSDSMELPPGGPYKIDSSFKNSLPYFIVDVSVAKVDFLEFKPRQGWLPPLVALNFI